MAPYVTSTPRGVLFEDDTIEENVVMDTPKEKYERRIVWLSVIIFGYFHLAALYGAYLVFTSAKLITDAFALVLYISTCWGVTAGAHRLWSHKAYKAKRPLQVLLMILHTTAFQFSVINWARDHRLHHKYSETNADPHNPSRGIFFTHIGWLLCKKHPDVKEKGKEIDVDDLKRNPVLAFQKRRACLTLSVPAPDMCDIHLMTCVYQCRIYPASQNEPSFLAPTLIGISNSLKTKLVKSTFAKTYAVLKGYYIVLVPLLCFIIPTVVPVLCWNETWLNAFFVPTILRYVLILNAAWLINSAAHAFGSKPYDKSINPSENLIANIFTFGEGWHNYHHVFPWDYKTAELGNYGLNGTTAFIDFFAKIGWAYDLKVVSRELVQKRVERTGDGSHEVWGWGDADQTIEERDQTVMIHRLKKD